MKGDDYRVVYPDTAQNIAMRMMHYLDAVHKDISYGYRHPQMSIPFVVHPSNMMSNGLVMWLPKRVEFLSSPAIDSYSMPWLKQLVAHEYRHAVQYNNLNRGIVKGLSYVIGQQSSTIGLLFMPLWMMEGDAVMIETEMSTFGRGLQPSFTMAYRAYGNVADEFKNIYKWFCGSYKDYIPDHYALGYLLSRHGYKRFGSVIGDDVAWLTSRRPYMVVSSSWVLKRLYGSTTKQLFYDTFRTLEDHWSTLEEVEQTTMPIAIPQPRSHTKYSHPLPRDNGRIVALKEDLDHPSAFVEIDTLTGNERHIAYTGAVSTRPIIGANGRIWWTEYHRSPLYAEKVTSRLWYMDPDDKAPQRVRRRANNNNILYPTPTSEHGIAWVEYTPDGIYSIVVNGKSNLPRRTTIPAGCEVHGMAWDNATEGLFVIITDDRGMHIAEIKDGVLVEITRPAYTTLSDLTARDGKLYYGSIASGRDEIHCYDIKQQREFQLTTSRYGSFDPTPMSNGKVLATSYDRRGYMPVTQDFDDVKEVEYAPHAQQILLPEMERWNVVNLDTVSFTPAIADTIKQRTPDRRFRRFAHAFNIHSWAPASYDPYSIVEESRISFNLGATLMSQNILSTMEGFLTWGWNHNEGSVFSGTLRYNGLGVTLWVSGTYGGSQNIHTVYIYDPDKGFIFPEPPKKGKYYSVSAGATLPIMFHHGYHTRQLVVSTAWGFSNGMVANVDKLTYVNGKITNFSTIGYKEGVHSLQTSIGFQDMVRKAHRDFLPPWGIVLSAGYSLNPATNDFGHLAVVYGKVYTPGFVKHHSLSLAASYQLSLGGFQSPTVLSGLTFKSTRLLPRGFSSYDIENDHYVATSLNYQMPVWYPDSGFGGVIFFKRLRVNLGGDYASFNRVTNIAEDGTLMRERRHIWSYGTDITADFNVFSMPDAATMSATLSFYMKGAPHDTRSHNKLHVSFGLGLPF